MKIFIFLLFPAIIYTQNLVVNPSFEMTNPSNSLYPCAYTKEPEHFSMIVKGWTTVARSTPDLILRPDSLQHCYFPKPHSGEKAVGFIHYLPQFDAGYDYDYHEYMQGTLTESLQSGVTYNIEFWLYYADSLAINHVNWLYSKRPPGILSLATNNFGFYFTTKLIQKNQYIYQLNITPQFNITKIIHTGGKWQRISGTFKADKAYRYFTIGNFYPDSLTEVNKPEQAAKVPEMVMENGKFVKKIWRIAYYCIDDVSITPYNDTKTGIEVTESTPYTFEKVLFNTGKATLLPGAEEELATLANYIKENTNVKFEIGGHTDNVGDDAANQILSEKRAKTVYDYLITLGINNNQLSYKGYGETSPKASNDTPEGRQQNRRVECKVMNNYK